MIVPCAQCGQKNRVAAPQLHRVAKCGRCSASLGPPSHPISVSSVAEFDEIVQHAGVPVLVDFWAAWCGPCRMAAPEVDKTAQHMAGAALVLKVDTEAHPQLAARYDVRGIPNFAVFRGGRLVKQQAGLVGHGVMESWLRGPA